MSGADRALCEAFQFDGDDLVANRAGHLSTRQTTLLRASRAGMRLSLAVFAVVVLGSVGLVAFFSLDTPGGWSSGLGVPAIVGLVVIVTGWFLSRGYLAAARGQRVSVTQGPVEILSAAEDDCRVRIGTTHLRLPALPQLEAFQAGTEYRVYYLEGPVAIVLSAETLWTRDATPHPTSADGAPGKRVGDQLAVFRRAYVIVALLGGLALGIPVAGALISRLPPGGQSIAWISLLAIAIGFAWFALTWLRLPGRRG